MSLNTQNDRMALMGITLPLADSVISIDDAIQLIGRWRFSASYYSSYNLTARKQIHGWKALNNIYGLTTRTQTHNFGSIENIYGLAAIKQTHGCKAFNNIFGLNSKNIR